MVLVASILWGFLIFSFDIRKATLVLLPLLVSFACLMALNFNKLNFASDLQNLSFLMLLIALIKLWRS